MSSVIYDTATKQWKDVAINLGSVMAMVRLQGVSGTAKRKEPPVPSTIAVKYKGKTASEVPLVERSGSDDTTYWVVDLELANANLTLYVSRGLGQFGHFFRVKGSAAEGFDNTIAH